MLDRLPLSLTQILLVVAAVLSFVELALTAAAADGFGRWSPNEVNFMVFNSVWSLLVVAYLGLTPIYFAQLFHQFASLALLAVTTLFWFAGAIAYAALVGPARCSGFNLCRVAQAGVAFGFFIWIVFTALLVFDVLAFLRSRNGGSTTASPTATQPQMGSTAPAPATSEAPSAPANTYAGV
ncbi:hypothetical protein ACRALDRAFT_1063970 [Sodiomyces alcalophilus JCM 7366]|uniref:uncharacterized protein n=1 Tax=Sodiomyces alcalophilus JCM 7366 TaxID=591952 RepID=UPI0039B5D1C6